MNRSWVEGDPRKREYSFKCYRNFEMFTKVNMSKLFLETDSETINVLKNQVELFLKSVENTVGGCPCNKKKRQEAALKVYKETVDLVKSNEEIRKRIGVLLNNPDTVLFQEGGADGAPVNSRDAKPFAEMKI